MWRIFSSNTYVEIIEKIEKLKTVGVVFLPAPFDHSSMRTWVFSDFFFWLTTKCPHAVPKCKQLSYEYIWPTLATYNKSCDWCEVKKKLSNKSPVDGFPSNYCGRKTVMSLTGDCAWHRKMLNVSPPSRSLLQPSGGQHFVNESPCQLIAWIRSGINSNPGKVSYKLILHSN